MCRTRLYFLVIIILINFNIICHGYQNNIICEPDRQLETGTNYLKVKFFDFSKRIKIFSLVNNAVKELITQKDRMNVTRKLIVYIPKFANDDSEKLFLNTFEKVNNTYIIVIDYSAYTGERNEHYFYYAIQNSFSIGQRIGIFIADIHRGGFGHPSKNIHIVGHGLGGQIAGFAAEVFTKRTGEKVSRITAIEPAEPCFSKSRNQVRSSLAHYVEIYHCNVGKIGSKTFNGDADFILNLEKRQVGCMEGFEFALKDKKCRENWCLRYWLWTVQKPTQYAACSVFLGYKHTDCKRENGVPAIAGYYNNGTAKGVFYASTYNYRVEGFNTS